MFNQNFVAQLWYFVKCIYFGLSAYQIRCGYPTRILGNFLTKKYNHLNLFLFQGYEHKNKTAAVCAVYQNVYFWREFQEAEMCSGFYSQKSDIWPHTSMYTKYWSI